MDDSTFDTDSKLKQPGSIRMLLSDPFGRLAMVIMGLFVVISIVGPTVAPYGPYETIIDNNGKIPRLQPPSLSYLLGTTNLGRDVFSAMLITVRPALAIGLVSAVLSTAIGAIIGLISGYYGGASDAILMRITDLAYAVPFLAFAMILITFVGPSINTIILAIALITWRTTARVIRAQVLVIREKPYIQAAQLAGISHRRIIIRHITPNVLPLCYAYVALTTSWAVVTEASISFLGYGDPAVMTWGKMLQMAYVTQSLQTAWWWGVPPALAITLLSLSALFIGRALEQISNPWMQRK